jgi:hypothetical protein
LTLIAGESVLIPINAGATISTVGNSGNGLTSLLSVTVAPSNENPGKQGEH